MRDPYEILGVSAHASAAEIKKAFRTLAKKYHPDAAGSGAAAKKRFQEINAAYEILGDPKKRAEFDGGRIDAEGNARGPGGFGAGFGSGFGGGFGGARGSAGGVHPEDIFADLFGGGSAGGMFTGFGFGGRRNPGGHRGAGGPRGGSDVQMTMPVGFREAALGGTRRVRLGDGREIDVKIPHGIGDGQQIRVKGHGNPGLGGGPAGDLLIQIAVAPDPVFVRDGNDLKCDVSVGLKLAVLGGRVPVETLTGTVSLSVPPWSNSGTVMRLRGKGYPAHSHEPAGDLYVRLIVRLPDVPDLGLQKFVEGWPDGDDSR